MGLLSGISKIFKKVAKPFIGGLGTTLLDLGGSFLSDTFIGDPNSAQAFDNNLYASERAFQNSLQAYGSRYQMTMDDMKKAGLNPIMAASSGFNVGTSPQMSSAQSFMTPPAYNVGSSGYRNIMEGEKLKAEEKEKIQNVQRAIANTGLAIQKTKESIAHTGLLSQQEKNASQEYWNLAQDFCIKSKQVDKITKEIYELQRRADLEHAQMELVDKKKLQLRSLVEKINAEVISINAKNVELVKRSNVYKGLLGQVNASIKETMSMLKLNFGLIGGLNK